MVLEFATKISDKEFPCHSFSVLLGMLPSKEDNGKFINIMFQKYIFRLELHRGFTESLRSSRGRKNVIFQIRAEPSHIFDLFSLPHLGPHITRSTGRRVALSVEDKMIRNPYINREDIIVHICRPEWLVGFLGKHYYYYPIVGEHYVGTAGAGFDKWHYATIPVDNAFKFKMSYDILSGRLNVSAKVNSVRPSAVSFINYNLSIFFLVVNIIKKDNK
jgi:hypothetical protein